jgi:hypothetical protein
MNPLRKRAALGTVLGIALAATVVVIGSRAMQSRTSVDVEVDIAIDEATESRTPIEVASLGPQIGETVPAFSLPDQNGQIRTLESVMGRNGTMLLFHRSADW